MVKSIYKKTRYQNIYKHIKNGNYLIVITNPRTSISLINDKKIFDIDIAKKIRDDSKIKELKKMEIKHKESCDELWDLYIQNCINVKKLSFNTLKRKEKFYNRYFKEKIKKAITKTNQEFWLNYIDKLDCSLKQKNYAMKELHAFFNWCIQQNIIVKNFLDKIPKYKVPKTEMKFWIPEQIKKFLDIVRVDLESDDLKTAYNAWKIFILTIITFSLGDRIGETRALSFKIFKTNNNIIKLFHSINYDPKSASFVKETKNEESEREIYITSSLIQYVEQYKKFLIEKMKYPITDDTLLFFNHERNRPLSDSHLREIWNYYILKANVPKIRMYDLRHTYAATMMSEGKEAYLFSKRMGHKSINTTINMYGHLSPKIKKEVANATDKYLN